MRRRNRAAEDLRQLRLVQVGGDVGLLALEVRAGIGDSVTSERDKRHAARGKGRVGRLAWPRGPREVDALVGLALVLDGAVAADQRGDTGRRAVGPQVLLAALLDEDLLGSVVRVGRRNGVPALDPGASRLVLLDREVEVVGQLVGDGENRLGPDADDVVRSRGYRLAFSVDRLSRGRSHGYHCHCGSHARYCGPGYQTIDDAQCALPQTIQRQRTRDCSRGPAIGGGPRLTMHETE